MTRYKTLVNQMSSQAKAALAIFLFQIHDIDTDLNADLWRYQQIVNHKTLLSAIDRAQSLHHQQKKKKVWVKKQRKPQGGLNNFDEQQQPNGNSTIKSSVTVPVSSDTINGLTTTGGLILDFKQPLTPYNSVVFGKPIANIAKSFQNYRIRKTQLDFKPVASGIAPGNYLATILQPGQFQQIFGNNVQGIGSFFSTLLQTGKNIVSALAKPARMIASAAMSKAGQIMYPSSTNEVLATNGDLVISQNTQLTLNGPNNQQPYPPLMKNLFEIQFLNMKPSSANTSYNDPVATCASGIISGQLTPAAALALSDLPSNFTIFPSLYPAGGQTINNAIRVKNFSGILTVTITFTGSLPVTWTSNIQLYEENVVNSSLRHPLSSSTLQSRRYNDKGSHTSQITYRIDKQVQIDDSYLYLNWLPTAVYPNPVGTVILQYSFASCKQLSINQHLVALQKQRDVREKAMSLIQDKLKSLQQQDDVAHEVKSQPIQPIVFKKKA